MTICCGIVANVIKYSRKKKFPFEIISIINNLIIKSKLEENNIYYVIPDIVLQ